MKLNRNIRERAMGIIFIILWLLIFTFYLTWDGWLYEWRSVGYTGVNQHFDFDFFDMKWSYDETGVVFYNSTNNLHNIIYICYFVFILGGLGLLFDNEYAKQGVMATLPISVISLLSTLNPQDHLYIVQIVYDIVHLSGTIMGVYFFCTCELKIKKTLPAIFGTWALYILSRLLCEPWPYWAENCNGYFSTNQINEMPLYFYGFEYGGVVIILLLINYFVAKLNSKIPKGKIKGMVPILVYVLVCLLLQVLGLIKLQDIPISAF